jgi:hypothetical protein
MPGEHTFALSFLVCSKLLASSSLIDSYKVSVHRLKAAFTCGWCLVWRSWHRRVLSFDLGLHLCKFWCGWNLLSSPWEYFLFWSKKWWSHSVPLRQERNSGDSLRCTCVRCQVPWLPYTKTEKGDTPETIRQGLIPLRTAVWSTRGGFLMATQSY